MSERGVYFRKEDYAGFWRRLLVDLADLVISVFGYVGLAIPTFLLAPEVPLVQARLLLLLAALWWLCYFVLLKWSRFRTLGYRLGSLRLTNLQGQPPGLFAVTLRSAFMVLGPLNYVLDLAWLAGDPHRQAMRDKFAHTYVVRADARPLGEGPVHHLTYSFAGMTLLIPEVKTPPSDTPLPTTDPVAG